MPSLPLSLLPSCAIRLKIGIPKDGSPAPRKLAQRSARDFTLAEALVHWQWWAICLLLCINTMAGLSIVAQAAPIFQEMGRATSASAAALLGIISIGNGLGRVFWAWVSDLTSRKTAYFLMYLAAALIFWSYSRISSLTVLAIATFVLVMCYGGGYGITPAFAADYFGPRNVGPIFGLMMLPWAFASRLWPFALRLFASDQRHLHRGPLRDRQYDDCRPPSSYPHFSSAQQPAAKDRRGRSGIRICYAAASPSRRAHRLGNAVPSGYAPLRAQRPAFSLHLTWSCKKAVPASSNGTPFRFGRYNLSL